MVFFFKQKTAYEMRISDWSSDVCSSDLRYRGLLTRTLVECLQEAQKLARLDRLKTIWDAAPRESRRIVAVRNEYVRGLARLNAQAEALAFVNNVRSEEHTSELQSLMRISYAVFCLKKKKQHKHNATQPHIIQHRR